MKPFITLLATILISGYIHAQDPIAYSIEHDGLTRDYYVYVPAAYDGSTNVPVVVNFHGFGSNYFEQMFYGDFRTIADTANFILVLPDGTLFNNSGHWNVGGFTSGSTVDDIGFVDVMLDELMSNYNVDTTRIYSTGMSNGGYFSFLLACQLSERIAAIASVTGSMTPETYNDCNPQHPMPVMQIHGDMDLTVPYEGAAWSEPIPDVVLYWRDFNNCEVDPTFTEFEDTAPNDGSTAEEYYYAGGDDGSSVSHIKVLGGGHTWPGSVFNFAGTNQDFNASDLIWKFFRNYDINGVNPIINTQAASKTTLKIYPNPVTDELIVERDNHSSLYFKVYDLLGNCLQEGYTTNRIDVSTLPPNLYLLHIDNQVLKVLKQ